MATKELDEELVQFDDQAFLWDFIKSFNNQGSNYANFIQIKDKTPVLTQNKLYGEGANALHMATTAQLSSLVPKFKLYKSIQNGSSTKNIEFPFNKITTVESITDSDLGRGTDVGFMQVKWTDTGTNPANVGVSFLGDITIKFQSFEALFKKRKSGSEIISFADLLNPEELTGRKATVDSKDQPDSSNLDNFKTQVKMVVGWETPHDPGNNLDLNSIKSDLSSLQRTYIIKNTDHSIDVNGQDASITLNIKFTARIEGMLLNTRTDLLYIDPSLEGEIDKQAKRSLENGKKTLLSRKEKLKERLKKLKETREKEDAQQNTSGNTDVNKDIENLEKELENINKELKYNISETKAIAYRRLLVALRSNITNPTNNSDGKIKYIDIDENTYRSYLGLLKKAAKSTEELVEAQKKTRQQAEQEATGRLNDPSLTTEEKNNIKNEIQQQVNTATDEFKEDFRKNRINSLKQLESIVKKLIHTVEPNGAASYGTGKDIIKIPDSNDKEYKPSFYQPSPGTIRMHYFYLGDLIEAAMEIVYKRPLTKNSKLNNKDEVQNIKFYEEVKLALGSFVYYNPVTEESIQMDMCDIPISLNYFNAWFYDNVIKLGLTSYTLRSFLRDLCSKLLNNVMSPTRYGAVNPIKSFSTRIQSIRMDKKSFLEDFWSQNYGELKGRVMANLLVESARQKSVDDPSNSINKGEWIYLYTVGSNSDFLAKNKGKSSFNIFNDIPHFYIGGQKGMLREVSFSRTQIPGKLEAALSSGASPARKNLLFQNKYDAQVSIFGNPVFKPGMLIYLDPRGIGLGTPEGIDQQDPGGVDFKYDLGIGGYYRVHNVSNEISSGIFTTTLSTTAELDLRDIRILNKKQPKLTN
jgi:hypothetical protein